MTGSAKQSIVPRKERMDCFVAEFIIGPAEGRTRWLLAMTRGKSAPNSGKRARQVFDSAFFEANVALRLSNNSTFTPLRRMMKLCCSTDSALFHAQ